MNPGQMALTRMPSCAKRMASERVRPSTPAFDAAYAGFAGLATMPWIDAMPTTAASGALARSCDEERLHDHRVGPQVDLDERVPGLVGEVGEVDGVGHAGRVHHTTDGADGGDGLVGGVGEACACRARRRPCRRSATPWSAATALGGLGGAFGVEVPDRHRAADLGDRMRGGEADAGGAAGDHDAGGGVELESWHDRHHARSGREGTRPREDRRYERDLRRLHRREDRRRLPSWASPS